MCEWPLPAGDVPAPNLHCPLLPTDYLGCTVARNVWFGLAGPPTASRAKFQSLARSASDSCCWRLTTVFSRLSKVPNVSCFQGKQRRPSWPCADLRSDQKRWGLLLRPWSFKILVFDMGVGMVYSLRLYHMPQAFDSWAWAEEGGSAWKKALAKLVVIYISNLTVKQNDFLAVILTIRN